MKLKATDQYLLQPSLSLDIPDTLMGVPVYQSPEMLPASTKEQGDSWLPIITVEDFKKAYKIVDSIGIKVLRDPYTNKPYVNFVTKCVGGGVVMPSSY